MKFTMRLLLILFLQAGLLVQAGAANAQEGGTLNIGVPQIDSFPTIWFHLSAYNAQGDFIDLLEENSVEIVEDGQILQPEKIEKIDTGLQIIIALNTSPALNNPTNGISEYQRLQQALQDWAIAQEGATLDDFSLATPTGLFLIRSTDPQQLHRALAEYQPDLLKLQPSLTSLAEAIDLATDPLNDPLARRSILYITPPLVGNNDTSLADLASRARSTGVQVNIWLIGPAAPGRPEPLQQVAEATGGKFFQIAPAAPLPDIEMLFSPLRQTYRVQYASKIRTSGSHSLGASVRQGMTQLSSNELRFELNVQPPNPIFLDPPAVIRRSWTVPDTGSAVPNLDPEQIELQVLIEFPDQHPRAISTSRLYVNDELVVENTTEPYDRFNWAVGNLTTPASLQLRVEVIDDLGLSGSTNAIPVEILVDQPAKAGLYDRLSQRGVIAIAAIAVSGAVLAVVLTITSSRRTGRRNRKQAGRKQLNDPLTQPVATRPIRARKEAARPQKEREPASPMAVRPQPAIQVDPARLVTLDENEQPVTGGAIPLTRQEVTFGSDPQRATQVLNSPTVDGLHARLFRTPEGHFILADQNSIAGTWINFAPVTANGARLEHGDLIHIGKVMFRFEITDPARISPAQARVIDLDSE